MSARVIDTETTSKNDPVIVEVAWLTFDTPESIDSPGASFEQRFNPGKPISLGAQATHHISNEDVANCQPATSFRLPRDTTFIIGHNADFDWMAIGKPGVRRICTLALARKLWPEADTHTLGAMMYLLEPSRAKQLLVQAHSAMADVLACRILLKHILTRLGNPSTWDEVWQFSEESRIPSLMPFGKHEGTPIPDLPLSYREWILGKDKEMDPYLITAVKMTMPQHRNTIALANEAKVAA